MTTTLHVQAAAGSYPFVVGDGLLEQAPSWLQDVGIRPGAQLFLITDDQVAAVGIPSRLKAACEAAGYIASIGVVRAGDASKSLATAEQLYQSLVGVGLRRDGVVVAVGGGMVGDLAGFVAATYQRGVRFVQVPTTLLAHDSSIGGKVGVNLAEGKNLVGAFYPPRLVLYDTSALATLPEREWRGGMAEVLKHGLIGDPALFQELTDQPVPAYPGPERTESLVARASAVKVAIVEQDEREQGPRMQLNLGHTVGHAIEQCSDYQIHHGEAVALGIVVEAELAAQRRMLSETMRDQITSTFCQHGLPVTLPDLEWSDVAAVMERDKKHRSGRGWTLALPRDVGDVVIVDDVTPDEVARAWQRLRGAGPAANRAKE
ncbi:MAG: 3-dehydroquinate synthase [Alicyclobacillus sp.]|nr:3-dehydroquinate synthase [Alicyclobacillus sp.]